MKLTENEKVAFRNPYDPTNHNVCDEKEWFMQPKDKTDTDRNPMTFRGEIMKLFWVDYMDCYECGHDLKKVKNKLITDWEEFVSIIEDIDGDDPEHINLQVSYTDVNTLAMKYYPLQYLWLYYLEREGKIPT